MADTIYLVRHAAPPPERRGRYWGRGDPGVDAESLAGVPPLAGLVLDRPARLLSSPLRRAAATAERLSGPLGLDIEEWPDLAEADFGTFDGLTFAEIERLRPDEAARWADSGDAYSFPDGESVAGFLRRVESVWLRLIGLPEPAALAATHGGVIASMCCLFLGIAPERRFVFRPEYAALTAFARKKSGSGWEMLFFNNKA